MFLYVGFKSLHLRQRFSLANRANSRFARLFALRFYRFGHCLAIIFSKLFLYLFFSAFGRAVFVRQNVCHHASHLVPCFLEVMGVRRQSSQRIKRTHILLLIKTAHSRDFIILLNFKPHLVRQRLVQQLVVNVNIPRPVSRIFVNGDVLYGLFDRPQLTRRELAYLFGKTEKTISAMLRRAEIKVIAKGASSGILEFRRLCRKVDRECRRKYSRAELEQVIARRLEQIPKIDVKARLRVLAEFVEFAEIIRLNVGAKAPDKGE